MLTQSHPPSMDLDLLSMCSHASSGDLGLPSRPCSQASALTDCPFFPALGRLATSHYGNACCGSWAAFLTPREQHGLWEQACSVPLPRRKRTWSESPAEMDPQGYALLSGAADDIPLGVSTDSLRPFLATLCVEGGRLSSVPPHHQSPDAVLALSRGHLSASCLKNDNNHEEC